jgi:hypothetical protein
MYGPDAIRDVEFGRKMFGFTSRDLMRRSIVASVRETGARVVDRCGRPEMKGCRASGRNPCRVGAGEDRHHFSVHFFTHRRRDQLDQATPAMVDELRAQRDPRSIPAKAIVASARIHRIIHDVPMRIGESRQFVPMSPTRHHRHWPGSCRAVQSPLRHVARASKDVSGGVG